MTKSYECMLAVSGSTVEQAGLTLCAFPQHQAVVLGRDEPVGVYAVADLSTLSEL